MLTCPGCGEQFTPGRRYNQRFCDADCRERYWNRPAGARDYLSQAALVVLPSRTPRFAAGDLVHVRDSGHGFGRAVWRVERRDYWHTDTQPAYRLRHSSTHIRFAFDSDLVAAGDRGGRGA